MKTISAHCTRVKPRRRHNSIQHQWGHARAGKGAFGGVRSRRGFGEASPPLSPALALISRSPRSEAQTVNPPERRSHVISDVGALQSPGVPASPG